MFIVFEGADGCGKSTQLKLAQRWLTAQAVDCVTCRDPGTTELGNRIRSILLNKSDISIGTRAELLLFMVARAQLVEEVIRPALAQDQFVLCDRFLLSTVVYQGYGFSDDEHAASIEEIYRVGQVATSGTLPDLTLVFDAPADIAETRLGSDRDRMESRGQTYFERVRQGFLEESNKHPSIQIIDASGTIEAVHQSVVKILSPLVKNLQG